MFDRNHFNREQKSDALVRALKIYAAGLAIYGLIRIRKRRKRNYAKPCKNTKLFSPKKKNIGDDCFPD